MAYLSRATMGRGDGSLGALKALLRRSAQEDQGHQLIWTLFGDDEGRKRDFLYRYDDGPDGATFWMLSEREPKAPDGDASVLWDLRKREFDPAFAAGDALRFQLRANPTKSEFVRGSKRGKVRDLMGLERTRRGLDAAVPWEEMEPIVLGWLFAREDDFGVTFDRDNCFASNPTWTPVPIKDDAHKEAMKRQNRTSHVAQVDYAGVLAVKDPDRFAAKLRAGFGRAKAYGCGLMLVRPA